MSNVIIFGGGISGLSAAYYLSKFGKNVVNKVTLIDKSTILGGWIRSSRYPDGTVHEHGPKSIRVFGESGYNSLCLVDELGLSNDVIPVTITHPAVKNRLIMADNKLHVIPSSLLGIFKKSSLFGHSLFYSGVKEMFTKKQEVEDESVHSFITRRFGLKMADYLFDPICRGIVAGDSKSLSIKSLFPNMLNGEQEYGSVVNGMIKNPSTNLALGEFLKSNLAAIAKKDNWSMWSLDRGLQTLTDRLVTVLDEDDKVELLTNMPCDKLRFEGNKAIVHYEGETAHTQYDHVFSSIPAKNLSKLVSSRHPTTAKYLSSISSVHVAVVNLEFEGKVIKEKAFGFLVPSNQNSKLLGITFDSCSFPEHDGKYADKTRITCMMGGHWFKDIFGPVDNVSNDEFLEVALESARNILGIIQPPIRHQVNIMRNSIPQYKVGHHKVISNLEKDISEHNMCLSLIGSSYEGFSVNDCIYNSRQAVENYIKNLG